MLPPRGLILLLLSIAIVGCTMRIGDFTVGSSRNIGQLSHKGDSVEGEDCSTKFIGIPIAGPMIPNMKTAVDKALEKAKGDVVADAVLWHSQISALIIDQQCFKVEGKVARGEFGKK